LKGGKDRTSTKLNDFSGGLFTRAAVTELDPKFSPNCQDVYAEGKYLRKRLGFKKLTVSTLTGNPAGNGIYNWVKSATSQLLVTLFGSGLKKMDISGTAWDGTWDTLSEDANNGTVFSNDIMHFVTYQGTLIMTTESRDKPQRMVVSDASHFNLDYNGSGTVPQGKYPQVWKTHVWILNLGSGKSKTEECSSITTWTDNDTGTGASTQGTFQTNSTFRFSAPANGDLAKRTKNVGMLPDNFALEVKTYFDVMESAAGGNYAEIAVDNGIILFRVRFSDDGLEIYDGTTWNEVNVNIIADDVWREWKFIITASSLTSARVDIYRNSVAQGLQYDCSNVSAGNDGQIDLIGKDTDSPVDWYLDYLYISDNLAVTNYITNGNFTTWDAGSAGPPTNWSIYPTQPYTHYKCNDNAANTAIDDVGSTAHDGTASVNTSLLSVTEGIFKSLSFTSASSHLINANGVATAIADDTAGSICYWITPDVMAEDDVVFSISELSSDGQLYTTADGKIVIDPTASTVALKAVPASGISLSSRQHLAYVQDGSALKIYLNAVDVTLSWNNSTDKGAWCAAITASTGTINTGRLACISSAGGGDALFFDGKLDDFRYYKKALTVDEVEAIYSDGVGTENYTTAIQESADTGKIKTDLYSTIVTNNIASLGGTLVQTLTSGSGIAGQPSVLGAWVKTAASTSYQWRITDGTSTYDSDVLHATGSTAFFYETFSFTPVSAATEIKVKFLALALGSYYVDHVAITQKDTGLVTDNSDVIQRSVVGTYDSWDGLTSGSDTLITAGDIGLTGSFLLNDKMYVTKKWSMHRFTYTGSTPLVDIKEIKKTVGTASPRSVVNFDTADGEQVFFLGTDRKIYIFDGGSSTSISDRISVNNGLSSFYTTNINAAALNKAYSINHQDLGWIELFVPLGTATEVTDSIIYDYVNDSFWGFSNRIFRSADVCDNGNGQRVVYVQGVSDGLVSLLNSTNSDNGTAIDAYWVSPKIGKSTILNKIDELDIVTDSVVATPIISWRADWETSWTDKTLGVSSNSYNYSPDRVDNLIQLKISDDSILAAFKLWSLEFISRPIGGGK